MSDSKCLVVRKDKADTKVKFRKYIDGTDS